MKWITTDYKGNKVEWYSADVIKKIKFMCQSANCLGKQYISTQILDFLNEVDQ